MTVTDALTVLEHIATTAQTAGLVPGGPPAMALLGVTMALQATLASGVLTPGTVLEIHTIGDAYAASVDHMRQVMNARTPLGELPPA